MAPENTKNTYLDRQALHRNPQFQSTLRSVCYPLNVFFANEASCSWGRHRNTKCAKHTRSRMMTFPRALPSQKLSERNTASAEGASEEKVAILAEKS